MYTAPVSWPNIGGRERDSWFFEGSQNWEGRTSVEYIYWHFQKLRQIALPKIHCCVGDHNGSLQAGYFWVNISQCGLLAVSAGSQIRTHPYPWSSMIINSF